MNLSIFDQFNYFIQLFALIIKLVFQVRKKQITHLENANYVWSVFVYLGNLFHKFWLDESVVERGLFFEMMIFLDFLVEGLEEFDDSCGDTADKGFLGGIELMWVCGKELECFLLDFGLIEFVVHFIEEEFVFGHLIVEEHLGGELFGIGEDELKMLNGLETDLLFEFDDFDDKVEFVFELLFWKFSFCWGLVHWEGNCITRI